VDSKALPYGIQKLCVKVEPQLKFSKLRMHQPYGLILLITKRVVCPGALYPDFDVKHVGVRHYSEYTRSLISIVLYHVALILQEDCFQEAGDSMVCWFLQVQVSDRSDPIFREIQSLMTEKRVLSDEYKNAQFKLNSKRCRMDAMLDEAFGSRRRGNPTLLSENSCDGSRTAMTPMSSTPPTMSVSFPSMSEVLTTSPSAVLPTSTPASVDYCCSTLMGDPLLWQGFVVGCSL
jgi:hypothetical protein